jgi:hypothetical protein
MANTIIKPKQTWREKLLTFSPQVKAALIAAAVTLVLAPIGICFQFVTYTNETTRLKRDLSSNSFLSQIQAATLQSYQLENAKLSRQIAGIEAERDPAAKAVKKRATNLASEIFNFLQKWRKDEPDPDHLNEVWVKGTSQDFSKAFMEHADKSMDYARSMGIEFARRFLGRLATSRDQLKDLGSESATLDKFIADPVRTQFEVQAAAEELQKLADKIRE